MPKKKRPAKKALKVAIVPVEDEPVERIYSNYVVIRHSPYDFSLEFCELLPSDERSTKIMEKTGKVEAHVRTKIVLPTRVIPSLIQALDGNYKKYEKQFEKK